MRQSPAGSKVLGVGSVPAVRFTAIFNSTPTWFTITHPSDSAKNDFMTILTLQDGQSGSIARIAVDRGFNCYEFKARVGQRTVDVLDSEAGFELGQGRPSGNGIPILFPFPNRIAQGRYRWDGKDYYIPAEVAPYDNTGNAIHGFCVDWPWRVLEQTESSALGEFRLSVDAPQRRSLWPTDAVIRLRYTVSGAKLRAEVEIENPDSQPMPWGFGTHPYFKVPLGADSKATECQVFAPVFDLWHLTECLPNGVRSQLSPDLELSEGKYFGSRNFDNGFGVTHSPELTCSIQDAKAGLRVKQTTPGHYPELVIYTPPQRDSICFEPYTCMTDAMNLREQHIDSGWQTLAAGAKFVSWIDIEVEAITPVDRGD